MRQPATSVSAPALLVAATLVAASALAPGAAHAQLSVTFSGPVEAEEGRSFTIEVEVTDAVLTPTWSWDLDDDGAFDETPGAPDATFAAGTTDGPSMTRVGVRATNGVDTETQYYSVRIANLPPSISSTPPTTAAVRAEYRYEFTTADPAGDDDPVTVRLTSRPTGMEIAGNVITWTPAPDQRGRRFPAILRMDDGDGGEGSQMWNIDVAQNVAPGIARPSSPIERGRVASGERVTLAVDNADDTDGDPLMYSFRLSRLSSFVGDAVIESPAVPEADGATTSWTTEEPLDDGLWYWEAWASDEMEEGPRLYAQLVVGNELPPDAGPVGDGGMIREPPSGGCSVMASGANELGPSWLLTVAGLLAWRRRRAP